MVTGPTGKILLLPEVGGITCARDPRSPQQGTRVPKEAPGGANLLRHPRLAPCN